MRKNKERLENKSELRIIELLKNYSKLNEAGKKKIEEFAEDYITIERYTSEILPTMSKNKNIIHIDFEKAI